MQISKNKVVTIDYTLKDDAGSILDTSQGGEPLSYIQGVGNLIPGLERALEGKQPGDDVNVRVEAPDAYGERDDGLTQVVHRDQFAGVDSLEVGMQFHAQTSRGPGVVTVTDIQGDDITVDGNHPLAGQPLNFEVSVVEVRDATESELSHGHVHGPGEHNH